MEKLAFYTCHPLVKEAFANNPYMTAVRSLGQSFNRKMQGLKQLTRDWAKAGTSRVAKDIKGLTKGELAVGSAALMYGAYKGNQQYQAENILPVRTLPKLNTSGVIYPETAGIG